MTVGFLHGFDNKLCAGVEMLTTWSNQNQMNVSAALAGRLVSKLRSSLNFSSIAFDPEKVFFQFFSPKQELL
jgi:hypothetical protein